MRNPWKKLSSRIVHKNKWFYVRKDKVIRPDGKKGEYNVVVTPPSVFIVALTNKREVCLVKLFRYTTNMYSLEIPAGGSDGEKTLVAAKRELREEAGLLARVWHLAGTFQTANGFMSEIGYVYVAQNLTPAPSNSQMEEGIEKVVTVPFKKALAMAGSGKITDGQTIIALHIARTFLGI